MGKRILKWLIFGLVFLAVSAVLLLWALYSGGQRIEDRSTPPVLSAAPEIVATLDRAPGNVAVSADGRIFLTLHPSGNPGEIKVAEWAQGQLKPYPDLASQTLFQTPLGIRIDRQGRLWTIDSGKQGWGRPRLLGFDLASGKEVYRHDFSQEIAPLGSNLQDLAIDPQGKAIFIADFSFLRKSPAIIAHDLTSGKSRRLLEKDSSVLPQNYVVYSAHGPLTRLGGLIAMKIGVDGIAMDAKGEWLYYGAISQGDLFRIRVADLLDSGLTPVDLSVRKEYFGKKVLSDGITLDTEGNVYLTDVEHNGIARLSKDRQLETLIRDSRIRWADGFSWGPEGWLYFTDSAIPDIAFRTRGSIQRSSPYYLFRFQPGPSGIPGQ